MSRAYLNVKKSIRDVGHDKTHVKLSQATSVEYDEGSGALESLGKGASVGATIGSAVPVPGVGTGVGTVVGSLVGIGNAIFGGGGEPGTKIENVVPILVAKVLQKKGAQTSFAHPRDGKRGKGGVKVMQKAFRKDRMMQAVKEIVRRLSREADSYSGYAHVFNDRLYVSNTPPEDRTKIIVSFPTPTSVGQAAENARTNSPTTATTNAQKAVYAIGAIFAALFLFR